MQLNSLAKVELHRHLEGSFRLSSLAQLSGLSTSAAKQRFQIDGPMKNLKLVLEKFLHTQRLLTSTEIIEKLTYECVEDAVKDNIKILELRYAPSFMCDGHSYSMQQAHFSIQKALKRAREDFDIEVGLIGIIVRTHSIKAAEESMEFFLDSQNNFDGVDLADDEAQFDAKQFEGIFSKARMANMPVTIHAGEVPEKKSLQNILDAVNFLGAQRIGHGVQAINDLEVLNFLKEKHIHLELCPISNWITSAIDAKQKHPFMKFRSAGVSCSVNSDDPGIFGSKLSDDYFFIESLLGGSLDDFTNSNRDAYRASFVKTKDRFETLFCGPGATS